MKKITNISLLLFLLIALLNCEEDQFTSKLNYVSFSEAKYSTGVDPGTTSNIDISVFATKIAKTDRVINVVVNTESSTDNTASYSVPSTVTIPAGTNKGVFSIQVTDTNLDCFNDVVFGFNPAEGLSHGSESTLTYYQKPSNTCNSQVTGTLDFVFDDYASEISFQILDVLGGIVVSGPSTAYADGTESAITPVTLCAGRCYTLIVKDSYGDGMSSPGSYTLTIGGTIYVTGDGDFEKTVSNGFKIN